MRAWIRMLRRRGFFRDSKREAWLIHDPLLGGIYFVRRNGESFLCFNDAGINVRVRKPSELSRLLNAVTRRLS